jgi:site-specific DNA recombinase
MNQARSVTVIQPTVRFNNISNLPARKRVAAYARVSTGSEEQQTSYDAQVDYYTRHIQTNPDWDYVEVYTDEGISGTSTKHREGFKRMMHDGLSGRMGLILTKSVSRFARNTVDTLTAIRKLKEKGVEIYFEKENIYTLDSKGELLLTIFSSLAQEESRSISENITWGQRKRFADGKVSLPYKNFLGYEKGEDGLPKVVEEQANIVRRMYALFLEGQTPSSIAKILTEEHIPTPGGKTKWNNKVVESILTNEKYRGDARLQKKITTDFLTKTMKVNEGEAPQYYVENSHEPVVSGEIFELVQEEFRRRQAVGGRVFSSSCFSSKIVCGDCGTSYGRKIWHSTDKYRQAVWQCNNKFNHQQKCSSPHLYEETIKRLFVEVFNSLITNRDAILADYQEIVGKVTDCSKLEKQSMDADHDCSDLQVIIEKFVAENAQAPLDQQEYKRRYDEYVAKYQRLRDNYLDLNNQITRKKAKYIQMTEFLKILKQRDKLLTEFDESLWRTTVTALIVKSKTEVVFQFKDGSERPWTLEEN